MSGSDGQDETTGRASGLPDVSLMSLATLFASDDTALGHAVRRVVAEVERSTQAISGWSSYIERGGGGA